MSKKTVARPTGIRELWGIFLLTFAVLLGLALISYRWDDIVCLSVPINDPPLNFIGPIGAWTAFIMFMTLGIGAYLVPVLIFALGIMLLLFPQESFLTRFFGSLAALLLLTAFLPLMPCGFKSLTVHLNIQKLSGGLFGWLLTDCLLCGFLGRAGGIILLAGLFIANMAALIGRPALLKIGRFAKARALALLARVREAKKARQTKLELLEEEVRQLAKQRAEIERRLKRATSSSPSEEPALVAPPPPRKAEHPPAKPEPEIPPSPEPSIEFRAAHSAYKLPPITLLREIPNERERKLDSDIYTTAKVIQATLAEFDIECEITNTEQGPTVTRYELLPAPGIRVENIVKLSDNLTMALKATQLRIQAPIPGKGVVGIEVPNAVTSKVYLREILESQTWEKSKAAIPLVLGKDVGGSDIIADLATMPHLLIAGATGSGKTVCMNTILTGILMSRTPEDLRLILVDPKTVEFAAYKNLPHLATPLITEHKKVIFGLRWAVEEMNKRYKMFARAGVRNIAGYNEKMRKYPPAPAGSADAPLPPHIPYVVIVIDELADLMMVARADIEIAIARLAQLSRAVGIHMILATQRPSVNVITGTIKANFPARISFKVAQQVDSRTILDASGADKLLGRGDMLFLPPGTGKLVRAQGAMVSDEDIYSVVRYIEEQTVTADFDLLISEEEAESEFDSPTLPGIGSAGGAKADEDAELLKVAIQIIKDSKRASVSLLQRRLRVGYNRASILMDELEERGIVGPARGSEPREILIDLDEQTTDNIFTGENDAQSPGAS